MIEPYQAVVVQACIQEPHRDEDMLEQIRGNIWRQVLLFRRFKFSYGRMKLIVLTETSAHGLDVRRSREQMLPFALEIPGPEYELYAMAAREFDVYLAACSWERDSHWPDTYFLTGFIIDPGGKCILKQRMYNGALLGSTTIGLYSKIVEAYGDDGGFGPVAVVDTDIGRLGLCVGGDLLQVESNRAAAMRGAEVIVQPMGERNMEMSPWLSALKRTVAFENQAYFVSANMGQYIHQHFREPAPSNDELVDRMRQSNAWGEFEFMGRSQIIGPNGEFLAFIPAAGESATGAVIDVERLRADRLRHPRMVARHGEPYAREYARHAGPALDGDSDWDRNIARNKEFRQRLLTEKTLVPSEGYTA